MATTDEMRAPLEGGERIGAYRLGPSIAAGGFGVVYRAEHAETGAPAAIKIMHPELAADETALLRFEREVEVVRRVRHPNVIGILDHGRLEGGRPWFAMELLSGMSLKEHLDARGRLAIDEALAILEPLCAAVAAAHERAIIHRDIKASNVFLEGGGRRVILLDFGLAKLLDAAGPGLTSSRHIVGTVSCMAPEQILNRPVDERTDVYALGVLAYRMLTGVPPFTARSAGVLQQLHLYAVPRPPSSRAPVSPALGEVLLRALAKEAAARPASVTVFLDELRAASSAGVSRAQARCVLGVYVHVHVDPAVLEAPGERLLADLDAILPLAAAVLGPAGFKVVLETSTSMLLAIERPADPAEDTALRRRALEAVAELDRRLATRAGADPDVEVRLYAHARELATHDGRPLGGDLLLLGAWLPDLSADGPLASREALAGLTDAPGRESAQGEWIELRRALAVASR